MKSMW